MVEGLVLAIIIIAISIFLKILFSKDNKFTDLLIKIKTLPEEDHVISFLLLKNKKYFISGLMNGQMVVYTNPNYEAILLIFDTMAPVTTLIELKENIVLASTGDGKLLIFKIDYENKRYQLISSFTFGDTFIFKIAQLNNTNYLYSNYNKKFGLIEISSNFESFKIKKELVGNEYIRDFMKISDEHFISAGKSLHIWDTNKLTKVKTYDYPCRRPDSIYLMDNNLYLIILLDQSEILIVNNKDFSKFKVVKINSSFISSCCYSCINNIILFSTFDEEKKKITLMEYYFEKDQLDLKYKNTLPINNINIIDNDNWERIVCMKTIEDNKVIFCYGGKTNGKDSGKLVLYNIS